MEEFIDNIKILINTLGHKVFEEIREIKSTQQQDQETFIIKAARGANAKGEPTTDGFLVHKGSKIATSTVPSMTSNFIKLRDELFSKGDIVDKNGVLEFSEDYLFSSPSTAAAIVMGRKCKWSDRMEIEIRY